MRKLILALAACGPALICNPSRAESPIPAIEALDEGKQGEAVDFVLGNAMFVLFHEAGHMLISEYQFPVLGKEEDAVDGLSTMVMLEAGDEALDKALTDAADGWFLSGAEAEAAGQEYAFWDEHSVDEQRAYSIVCMMVGQDPEGFKEFAASNELPEGRQEGCPSEYGKVKDAWTKLLEPHVRKQGGESNIDIVYDEAATEELKPYAEWLKAADVLTLLKVGIADRYVLEDGITFKATTCGAINAFWDPSTRTITYCYELAEFHAGLIAKYFTENKEE